MCIDLTGILSHNGNKMKLALILVRYMKPIGIKDILHRERERERKRERERER